MKANERFITQLTVGSLVLLSATMAHAEAHHFYLKGDVGGSLGSDVQLREFFGPVAANSEIKLDPGLRFGLRGGYGLTDWLDAEVETGLTANRIDNVTGATETKAALANVPLLLNARFHCPEFDKLSPYFGGGLGLSTTVLSGDDLVIGGTRLHGGAAGVAFGYQAFAGVRYALNDHMGLSVEYHYFATSSARLYADSTSGTTSDRARLGGTESHAFTLAFDYKF